MALYAAISRCEDSRLYSALRERLSGLAPKLAALALDCEEDPEVRVHALWLLDSRLFRDEESRAVLADCVTKILTRPREHARVLSAALQVRLPPLTAALKRALKELALKHADPEVRRLAGRAYIAALRAETERG